MNYLNIKALEILTCLLFQEKPIEVEKIWLEKYAFSLCCSFSEYLLKNKLNDVVRCSESSPNNILIKLENKRKLKDFLQNYINLYKKDVLEPTINDEVNYFSYAENLLFMKDALYEYSKNFNRKTFILDSIDLRNCIKNSPIGNERGRFLEFMLDIYFQEKNYIQINWSKISRKKGTISPQYSLKIGVTLLKKSDEIFKALLFKFYIDQPLGEYNDTLLTKLGNAEKEYAPKILQAYADGARSRAEIAKKVSSSVSRVREIEDEIKYAYDVGTTQQMLIKATQENIIRINSTF